MLGLSLSRILGGSHHREFGSFCRMPQLFQRNLCDFVHIETKKLNLFTTEPMLSVSHRICGRADHHPQLGVVLVVLVLVRQPGDDVALGIVGVPQIFGGDLPPTGCKFQTIWNEWVEAVEHREVALIHDHGFRALERQRHAVDHGRAIRGSAYSRVGYSCSFWRGCSLRCFGGIGSRCRCGCFDDRWVNDLGC